MTGNLPVMPGFFEQWNLAFWLFFACYINRLSLTAL